MYFSRLTGIRFSSDLNEAPGLSARTCYTTLYFDCIKCQFLVELLQNKFQVEYKIIFQIVFEGRNKYLINGTNANNMRVQDMFRSVQLNVNNPHFLIMQGRITKVLNMKPPEVNFFHFCCS